MKVYIAGPMTGIQNHNHTAFENAAKQLTALGYEVESPHTNVIDVADDATFEEKWHAYMALSVPQMLSCEGVALLPGWSVSKGAQTERDLALRNRMDVREIDHWIDPTRMAR